MVEVADLLIAVDLLMVIDVYRSTVAVVASGFMFYSI